MNPKLIRSKPKLSYNGLTVVLSNPSRFDKYDLLSANGGHFFSQCLAPELNRYQCDIRTKECQDELLPETKVVLCLGETAAKQHIDGIQDNVLGEIRGSVYGNRIASYYPQDCVDVKNYEAEFNTSSGGSEFIDRPGDNAISEKRHHGKTSWSNYGFWLDQDIKKVKHILKHGIPTREFEPHYRIYPPSNEIINELTNTKGKHLYIDIETDANLNILCLSYSFGLPVINVVPFVDHKYTPAYDSLHLIFRALSIAVRDNCCVAHNGACFDFVVLAWKYKIAIGRDVYDTMVAQSRIFPGFEKSLGHCTSLWSWEPFHKDEAGGYNTKDQAEAMWKYCGKDVYTMILIHKAQIAYAQKRIGMIASINQANASIRPYLITSLYGIQYDPLQVEEIIAENDALMKQYNRVIELLVGPQTVKHLRAKSKKSMPGSNSQCCEYFHNLLGYPVVARGKETKKGIRNASLAKTAIFKLRQKFDNPVLEFVIAFREVAKETSSLKFEPWVAEPTTTDEL